MIIRRYLTREVIKAQIAVLFILLVIFMSQKMIRILSNAVEGDIPSHLVFSILMLGLSDMFNLILPLSLFLGILIAFGRLYNESEMVVMFACGVKKRFIYQVIAFLALITAALTCLNAFWYGPWSSIEEELLLKNAKVNMSASGLLEGQFQILPNSNSVIYVGKTNKNEVSDIFIYQEDKNNNPALILASQGKIAQDPEGNQIIQLDTANRYEGADVNKEYKISYFKDYQAIIIPKEVVLDENDSSEKELGFSQLINQKTPENEAELFWRLTLILSGPLLAFLVIPLCASNPRQGKFNQVLPALLFYLVYFLAISSIKANGAKGRLDTELWMILLNCGYLILAILFNIWDTTPMRKLRYQLFTKKTLQK